MSRGFSGGRTIKEKLPVVEIAVEVVYPNKPKMKTFSSRLDYQPLFGKMSPHSSPERAAGRVRFPLLV